MFGFFTSERREGGFISNRRDVLLAFQSKFVGINQAMGLFIGLHVQVTLFTSHFCGWGTAPLQRLGAPGRNNPTPLPQRVSS